MIRFAVCELDAKEERKTLEIRSVKKAYLVLPNVELHLSHLLQQRGSCHRRYLSEVDVEGMREGVDGLDSFEVFETKRKTIPSARSRFRAFAASLVGVESTCRVPLRSISNARSLESTKV